MAVKTTTTLTDADHFVTYLLNGALVTEARALPLTVFAPDMPGTYPVIIYSHGLGGNPDFMAGLLPQQLADLGYIVIEPTHLDSARYPQAIREQFPLELETSALHRVADMQFALDSAQSLVSLLPGYAADLSHVAVGGHSFGAYTAMLLAGAVPDDPAYALGPGNPYGLSTLSDPRIDAVFLLSPEGASNNWAPLSEHSWDDMIAPVLAVTGTLDIERGLSSFESRLDVMRYADSGPIYAAVFEGADHNEVGGITASPQLTASIAEVTDTFLDAFLGGDAEALALLASPAELLADEPLLAAAYERAGTELGGSANGSGVYEFDGALRGVDNVQTGDLFSYSFVDVQTQGGGADFSEPFRDALDEWRSPSGGGGWRDGPAHFAAVPQTPISLHGSDFPIDFGPGVLHPDAGPTPDNALENEQFARRMLGEIVDLVSQPILHAHWIEAL